MATIWARSTGAWGGSIWDYFNENTQQIEAYPFANPQSGDIVYCNGFTITISGSIDIGNGTFTNGVNPYTNISGGHFGYSANPGINITGDCEQYGNTALFTIHISNSNAQFNVNGNLYNENNAVFSLSQQWSIRASFSGSFNIGNVSPIIYTSYGNTANTISLNISNIILRSSNVTELVHTNITTAFASYVIVTSSLLISPINVNVTTFSFTGQEIKFNLTQTFTTATITGNIELNANNTFTTANITGTIKANSYVLAGTTLNINGSINYTSSNNTMGIRYTTLNILNPDTFTWKDLTEPRSNPFIILTDAEIANRQQYPAVTDVKKDVPYAYGQLVGTFEPNYPPESVVLDGFEYGENMTGTMTQSVQVGCVTKEDVREGVPLIGMYEDGQQVVGTIIIPAEEDVREGVHYDNDKIGTLIVQGSGDRLRIADFGYYTNAQSDTYIVDLTEQDKPKFAVAEERILIEMFPSLDLDNIPEMYFDDLFVKYLKYRLIVEYYRTAGVNSTFTPSEPTTEIVNYRNVTCEVWLNSANTYLNAWNKKYDLNESPKKVRL